MITDIENELSEASFDKSLRYKIPTLMLQLKEMRKILSKIDPLAEIEQNLMHAKEIEIHNRLLAIIVISYIYK